VNVIVLTQAYSSNKRRRLSSDAVSPPEREGDHASLSQGFNVAFHATNSQSRPSNTILQSLHPDVRQNTFSDSDNQALGSDGRPLDSPYQLSDEDAYIQTLHRMGAGQTPTDLSTPRGLSRANQSHHVVEYFDRFSSISVLAEALGHRQQKRLIQIDLPDSDNGSAKNRELHGLDATDVAYLNSKRVFELPPKEAW
jgi:hypothetical protein